LDVKGRKLTLQNMKGKKSASVKQARTTDTNQAGDSEPTNINKATAPLWK
jgi:hypothetical protein